MTRSEFQSYCINQGERYGYSVTFAGIGSVSNAFAGQEEWQKVFPEDDPNTTFGFSTQAAVFTRLANSITADTIRDDLNKGIEHIATHDFPWSNDDHYPPSPEYTRDLIVKGARFWCSRFEPERGHSSVQEHVVTITCQNFYDMCYDMRRACHFDYQIYLQSIRPLGFSLPCEQQDLLDKAKPVDSSGNYVDDTEAPEAKLESLKFLTDEQGMVSMTYTYDLSSFLDFRHDYSYDEAELGASVSRDWNEPQDSPEIEWV